MEQSTILWVMT
ncbi:hypothetical protein F383_27509 [Gossypium arboreum]|uniref:Uncharacterized protein n=1 Tax=Gossypium arboreum TaxID=29729 RepID=A0A0B0P7B6_GOSAR|nr:hypothetical protein F383_27509 [Gossypium arboreum]